MSDVFGFEDSVAEMMRFTDNADKAKNEMHDVADEMRDLARKNAQAGGLHKSGAGISGIQTDHSSEESLVGWSSRPNLHLYFHELGFHALDNRKGKQSLKRTGKKRQRGYRGVKATYVPATPHMRPAFEAKEHEFVRRIQQKITE